MSFLLSKPTSNTAAPEFVCIFVFIRHLLVLDQLRTDVFEGGREDFFRESVELCQADLVLINISFLGSHS